MSSKSVAPPIGVRRNGSVRLNHKSSRKLSRGNSTLGRGSLGRSSEWLAVDPLQLLERKDGENANFGSIRFPGRQKPVRWVRCSVESDPQHLMLLALHCIGRKAHHTMLRVCWRVVVV